MPVDLPTDPQNLALWLLDNLECVERVAGTPLWEGRLPESFDFEEVDRHIEAVSSNLKGVSNCRNRRLGFHPSDVGVYEDLNDMLAVAANRSRVPERFAVRSLSFTYPLLEASISQPPEVEAYFGAVGLWKAICQLADLSDSAGSYVLFVAGHNARLKLRGDYGISHLHPNPSVTPFAAEFNGDSIHADQKRSIIRSVLIDAFKSRKEATFGEVLSRFQEIESEVRKSYAMYMAEFSVKKVITEVERQNLDDTLSLNKTLSDIQNQLLALPAAILLAGATLKLEEPLRNYAVLVGVLVFCLFMWMLIGNQKHSVNAISSHIRIRKKKVEAMPTDAGLDASELFKPLECRVRRQKFTLFLIKAVVAGVLIVCFLAVLDVNGHVRIFEEISRGWIWLRALLE